MISHARILLLFIVCCGQFSSVKAGFVTQTLVIIRGDEVKIHFDVELATTLVRRKEGLMGRTVLAPRDGMLFDFGVDRTIAMWMKGTAISLDMLFINAAGIVVYIRERSEPFSLERIESPIPAQYVLELNGGEISTYGLSIGDSVVLPLS